LFNHLVYSKGSWVLQMIRCELGDDLFRRCIRTYLQRHQFGCVVTEDFRAVLEELSGRSFDQFFDQWLYHGHFPELEIAYGWEEAARQVKVTVRQMQEVNERVLLFNVPLTVRFKGKFGVVDHTLQVTKKEEQFQFPLTAAPEEVLMDPDSALLARIRYTPPRSMVSALLADKDDVLARVLALEQLTQRTDPEALASLKQVLNHDPCFGLRIEAAKALRSLHSDAALTILIASTGQTEARVRRAVTEDIGGFYEERAREALRQSLRKEKNPEIIGSALRSLGAYNTAEVRELLLHYLDSESYRNELADAAIDGMRAQDDPAYLEPLMRTLGGRERSFTSRGFAKGLETIAYLARNEADKTLPRDFLMTRLNHKKQTIQLAAIKALGALGDAKAIAALETFTTASQDSRQRRAAETALTELRAGRKPVDDFKNLRQEVLELQKDSRELRKELDELKQQVTAKQKTAVPEGRKPERKPKA
jgi:aminopeptidase N